MRELSFTVRPYTSRSRPSAGTMSPVSRTRISPGTTWAEGMAMDLPSRTTRASGEERRRRLSRDFSAFWCCTVPRTAFNSRTEKITRALSGSPVSMDTAAAPMRIITSRSSNCARNTCHHWGRSFSFSTFSPYIPRRFWASASVSPFLSERISASTAFSSI